MFVLNKTKENNPVELLITDGIKTFTFENVLTKEKVIQTVEGIKGRDYTRFIIDGTAFKGGTYVVNVGDELATKCVVIGVDNLIKRKYQ